MWKCQLCQKEFDDAETKYQVPTTMLQDIFRGVVMIDIELTGETCYLCENCNQEKQELMEGFRIY
jgi:DNA-directed RNA polymerase subunit RPC12/RpoP